FLKGKKEYFVYIILALIAWFGYYIRTLNLNLLQGKYLLDPDAHLVLRYARYILEHGSLFATDPLRSYPVGFTGTEEFSFLSGFIVYLYKFLHFFNPNLTLTEVDIFYPAVAFVLALPFFYLLVKRLFGTKVALISSLFLTVIPVYLFRTMSGVSDKEALAMIFFYAAFYFFIVGWQSRRIRYAILFGAVSGLTTGMLGAIWGGVAFVIITLCGLMLVENLFSKLTRKDIYLFLSWALFSYLFLYSIFPDRYNLNFFIYSFIGWILLFTFIVVLIQFFVFELNILKLKEKLYSLFTLPEGIYCPLIIFIVGLICAVSILGPNFILDIIRRIFELVISKSDSRWELTVIENRPLYLTEWIVLFGPNNLLGGLPFFHILFWSFIIGSIFFFYGYIKILHKYKWRLTITYTLLLFAIIFSRYDRDSIFDGKTLISQAFYVGSFLIFISTFLLLYIYLYYKDKESFSGFSKLDKRYTLVLILSSLTAIAARTANRSLFVFAPIVIIFISYLIVKTYQLVKDSNKKNHVKYAFYIILFLIFGWSLYYYSARAVYLAADSGPGNKVQWNIAMEWVKQNTPKDAVFAHWWDYGYYVQTLAERPTVTDGGNTIGYWNYLMGRHFLTAQNETEALEWLKSHNVSYVLLDPSDIGKYDTYSLI
ncbi:glycosyltransferase family 39 protein, partial [Candidatus Woesearchaeota archaeon]|nr:glycosyltransferase family 39 protein [Candidatus Woesearchaeota archaeon]